MEEEGGGGGLVEWMLGYRQAAPTLGPCPLLPPNTQTSPRALLEGGGRGWGDAEEGGPGKRSKVIGFPVKWRDLQ